MEKGCGRQPKSKQLGGPEVTHVHLSLRVFVPVCVWSPWDRKDLLFMVPPISHAVAHSGGRSWVLQLTGGSGEPSEGHLVGSKTCQSLAKCARN